MKTVYDSIAMLSANLIQTSVSLSFLRERISKEIYKFSLILFFLHLKEGNLGDQHHPLSQPHLLPFFEEI